MESPLVPSFNPDTTLGFLEIGILLSYALFGLTTAQTYTYYKRFPNDSVILKLLVAFIWLCELGHAISIGHTLYVLTISDYGQPQPMTVPQSFFVALIFSGIIGSSVQLFFAHRVFQISRTPYIPVFCGALSVSRLVGTLVLAGYAFSVDFTGYLARFGWLLNAVWSISAANDVLIAGTLAFYLYRARFDAQKRTVVLLDKLIAWSIETGALTSAVNIVILASYLRMANTYLWLALFVITARLFANSLLASLNSRHTIRAMDAAHSDLDIVIPTTIDHSSTRDRDSSTMERSHDSSTHFEMSKVSQIV
ncbi:hypothetical protein C8R43DRAFT_1036276 [Mycena crocata]|nr:hypothetical protein C8R43DRAFT_1036276 [Mycena crocata]